MAQMTPTSNITTIDPSNETYVLFEYTPAGPFLKAVNKKIFQETLIPSLILVLVVLVLGVPGNSITLFVYLTRMRRNATRLLIIGITVCDLLNCLLTMPLETAIITNFWTIDFPIICKFSRTMTYILNHTSSLLLVVVAAERYRKICTPLKPSFSMKTMQIACSLCVVCGTIFSLPPLWFYGTFTMHLKGPVPNSYVTGRTCLVENSSITGWFPKLFTAYCLMSLCVISVILIVLYSFIVKTTRERLRLAQARKNSTITRREKCFSEEATSSTLDANSTEMSISSSNVKHAVSRQESLPLAKNRNLTKGRNASISFSPKNRMNRTTMTLFAITIAFIASFVPFYFLIVLRAVRPNLLQSMDSAEKSMYQFFLRSYVVQCAINPILYGFLNKEFRRKTKSSFRSCELGKFRGLFQRSMELQT